MATLHTTLEACRDHIRAAIYAIDPAAIDSMGEGWKAHNTDAGTLIGKGERVRMFDVVPVVEQAAPYSVGGTTYDYRVPFRLVIVYGMNENYNALALSDYASIYHKLSNLEVASVTGLHCYSDFACSISEDKDVRHLIVTFFALVACEG